MNEIYYLHLSTGLSNEDDIETLFCYLSCLLCSVAFFSQMDMDETASDVSALSDVDG